MKAVQKLDVSESALDLLLVLTEKPDGSYSFVLKTENAESLWRIIPSEDIDTNSIVETYPFCHSKDVLDLVNVNFMVKISNLVYGVSVPGFEFSKVLRHLSLK